MKAVGVKVLKAKLSEYLRLVKTGETVLVTEHDEVVAELRPAHRQKTVSTLADSLSVLADKGEILLRSEESSDGTSQWKGFHTSIRLEEGTSKELLRFLRGES